MLLQGSAALVIRTGLRAAYGYLVVYAGPLIIAPNHPSLLDAVMVLSRLPDVACVMKADLIDNPIYGASARFSDYIRNDGFMGAATQAIANLKGGSQLLLFPEGTRTTRLPTNS